MNTSASMIVSREGVSWKRVPNQGQTLPLFEDLAVSDPVQKDSQGDQDQGGRIRSSAAQSSPEVGSTGKKWQRLARRQRASDAEQADPHLKAARRLSRKMLRLPQNSMAQTQAGIAICRHLIASLDESH
ncbi:MAG: hypothetical protein O3A63_08760 [Proteobacteria bacterium]|nr:hypothetical protein [Pseudomonadota bacterium]